MIKRINSIFSRLVFTLLFVNLSSCETDPFVLPYTSVELHLNIISELGNPALFSTMYFDGGVNGLIIYREDYDLFRVYDRTCSLYPDHNTAVVEDSVFKGVYVCPDCGSQFLLSNPTVPLKGPATYFLHEYVAVVDGDLLHIYNY